jgi:hypothetical protein
LVRAAWTGGNGMSASGEDVQPTSCKNISFTASDPKSQHNFKIAPPDAGFEANMTFSRSSGEILPLAMNVAK